MEAEVTELVGAERYEPTDERTPVGVAVIPRGEDCLS